MYTGDYEDYYFELQDKFPNVKLGVQHSDKRSSLTVNVFGDENVAKGVLYYIKEDPSFVFATKADDGVYLFLLTDGGDRDKLRGVLSYFLGIHGYARDAIENWFSTAFVEADISFSCWHESE